VGEAQPAFPCLLVRDRVRRRPAGPRGIPEGAGRGVRAEVVAAPGADPGDPEGRLDPEVREWLDANPVFATPLESLAPDVLALARGPVGAPPTRELAEVHDTEVARVPVRVYRPGDRPTGTVAYFHGGGYCIGSVGLMDHVARELAHHSGATVVSVGYRLAPEHPFPAGLDDCDAVTTALLAQADGPLAVAGESAGGTLAAAVTLRRRAAGGPTPGAQVLIYPGAGGNTPFPSRTEFDGLVISAAAGDAYWQAYSGGRDLSAEPLAAPLRADSLERLPAALVVLALAYCFTPYVATNWFYFNTRFAPFLWVALLARMPERMPRAVTAFAAACAVLYYAGMAADYRILDRERTAFVAARAEVPRGAQLLPLVFDSKGASENTRPLLHAWGYYVTDRETSAPLLFAHARQFAVSYREAPPEQLNHLLLERVPQRFGERQAACAMLKRAGVAQGCDELYAEFWSGFWANATPHFDHVLLWSPPPEAVAAVPSSYKLRSQHGALKLFVRDDAWALHTAPASAR